ncbi:MAG: GNAT family N-acetyltransferase [Lewinellaceae bacterium]|nr:GNAT family N-acetyltransferase [Lewinellaceae bacterium]
MTTKIQYTLPGQEFWKDYSELWENAVVRSPFISPNNLRGLADIFKDELAIFQCYMNKKLIGAILLRNERGVRRLLSDIKADHNYFILSKNLSCAEKQHFFQSFFRVVKREKWTLMLKNKPAWAPYMDQFLEEIKSSGLLWEISDHTVCKVLEEASPEALHQHFQQSRELRYRVNRLVNQQGAVFEVLTGDECLEEWIQGFCEMHIKRWEGTPNPSKYLMEKNREILRSCLQAWITDGTLARFSVLIDGRRIGYVICLVDGNKLIHHSTTYDAEYRKYSPGKALLLYISEWMTERGLNCLDFGEGAESYKDEFTNKELILNRVFISGQRNYLFFVKNKVKKNLRKNLSKNQTMRKLIRSNSSIIHKIVKIFLPGLIGFVDLIDGIIL